MPKRPRPLAIAIPENLKPRLFAACACLGWPPDVLAIAGVSLMCTYVLNNIATKSPSSPKLKGTISTCTLTELVSALASKFALPPRPKRG